MKLKYISLVLLCCLAVIPVNLEAAAPAQPMSSTNFKVQGIFASAFGNAGTPNKMSSSQVFVPEGSFDGIADTSQFIGRMEVTVRVGGVDAADEAQLKGFSGFPGFFPGVSPTDVPYQLQNTPRLSAPNVFYLPYSGKSNQIRYVLTGYTGTGGIPSGSASSNMTTTVPYGAPLTLASTITWNYQKQVRVSVTTFGEDSQLKYYDIAGDTTAGSTVVTGLVSTSGLIVGMQVFGNGIPDGTTVAAVNAASGSVTLSAAATQTFTRSAGQRLTFAPGLRNVKGDTGAGSATVTSVASTTGLSVGMLVYGNGIPAGTTVTAITASTVTLSAVATQTVVQSGLTFAVNPGALTVNGDATASSATIAGLSSTTGLVTGMLVYGAGIPAGTTVAAVNTASGSVILSAAATEAASQSPLTFALVSGLLKINGNTTDTSKDITSLSSTAGLTVGMLAYGNGIPTDTTITSINTSGSAVTLSAAVTQTAVQSALSFALAPGASYSDPRECAGSDAAACVANSSAPYSGVHFYDASDTSAVTVTAKQSYMDFPSGIQRTLTQVIVNGGGLGNPVQLLQGDRKISTSIGMKTPMEVEWRYDTTLAFPIGQPISPVNKPDGKTVNFAIQPQITILAADATLPGDTVGTAFVWAWHNSSDAQRNKYFPIHPVGSFTIRWTCEDGSTFDETGRTIWPTKQKQIVGVPANLQPPGVENTFNSISYTTSGATATLAEFNTASAGVSILRFNTPPISPEPKVGTTFIVVESEEKPSNASLEEITTDIGKKITDDIHQDPEMATKTGYLYYNGGVYDGAGGDKAYDRSTRKGAIIPVNVSLPGDVNPLVVVWYEKGLGDIGWPTTVKRYKAVWPASPNKITIGTGIPVSQVTRPRAMVYNQTDGSLPGRNPNEEHALLTGDTLYALRNDLNGINNLSEPYLLLKYFNATAGEWMMDVFKVERPSFSYVVEAGTSIVAPLPGSFQVPPVSSIKKNPDGTEVGGEWHLRDHKGGHWAKAANWKDGDSIIEGDKSKFVMQWYYYMRNDFYWPYSGSLAKKEGDILPFLNNNGSENNKKSVYSDGAAPIDVTYITKWPATAPVLPVGDTLTTARNELPDLYNFMVAQVVFDESVYKGGGPLAKLYAPERYLYASFAPADYPAITAVIKTLETEVGPGGVLTFSRLPFAIQARLFYDDVNRRLGFKGVWIENEGEDPWMLPNLMTATERDTIKGLSSSTVWTAAVDALYARTRNPNNITLPAQPQNPFRQSAIYDILNNWGVHLGLMPNPEDTTLTPTPVPTRSILGEKNALSAGMAQGEGYVVIAENNLEDPAVNNLSVALHVVRIEKTPVFQGVVKAIKSKNVFDEKLTLHYTGDFGGEPEKFFFEWFYQPVTGSIPGLPLPGAATGNWQKFIDPDNSTGQGQTDITIQGASPLTLSDNWVVARYYYKNAWPLIAVTPEPPTAATAQEDAKNWSDWSGANTIDTPMLAMGWIKRVVDGLNPLEARVTDFRNSATNTTVSMLSQFGTRYEGDIAFSSDPNYLNSLGLISAYETVLNRGRMFSIDAVPPQNYGPTNDALLNITSRLATFYLALGNEAYADAIDPTIGFSTKSGEYGNMAPAIFAFQNQLDSLLDEELVLMRGRDDSAGSTKNRPYYNRLIWNFTQGEGEVAYAQNYNITDQDKSGVINAGDAKLMYPQGHGDAWGHYLQAINYYYKLLGHSSYSWEPRVEFVLVAGQPIMVDYLDERKFASIAAARAKAGADILDLTYKKLYTDDPAGQWQGYKDTYTDRAWGVDEWARRVGQGAYFDWLTANAVLPDSVPVTAHDRKKYITDSNGALKEEIIPGAGIQQIDRSKVSELTSIASQFHKMQSKMAEVDSGINPLGLVKGVVPFDIDPVQVDAGQTHFEQVYARAEQAMANAIVAFDHANGYTQRLRQNQDALEDFKKNLVDQERDYLNRLIEIFGYPYADDIGPGKLYKDGYIGPDIFHYNYVDRSELTGDKSGINTVYISPLPDPVELNKLIGLDAVNSTTRNVSFTIDAEHHWQTKPAEWTSSRRAPGRVQQALSELIVAGASYDKSLQQYNAMVKDIDKEVEDLNVRHNVLARQITALDTNFGTQLGLDVLINAAHHTSTVLKRVSEGIKSVGETTLVGMPRAVGMAPDVTSPMRVVVSTVSNTVSNILAISADVADGVEFTTNTVKAQVQAGTELQLAKLDANWEVYQMIRSLQSKMKDLDQQLLDTYLLKETIQQAAGNYQAALAEGLRLLDERAEKRAQSSADVQEYRFQDLGFRVFRNDAIQKYRAQFDLAAKYVYLAAMAYDYETNLLGTASGAGRKFLGEIAQQRNLGVIFVNSIGEITPQAGFPGLADVMARLSQNFKVYKTQLGFNNPQTETTPFSLRSELFRIKGDAASNEEWRSILKDHKVDDLWKIPEFKRYCRPFAPESAGPQPGIVIRFPTTVTYGKNFFGWPLSGGDSAYSTSNFATRVRSVGLWFENYNAAGLSSTPRVYLVPTGADVLRSPTGDGFSTREWQVKDQKLPVPFPLGDTDLNNPSFIPANDSLSDELAAIRRVSDFRAYPYSGDFNADQTTSDSRLIGRSVWNTEWMLIIPGSTLNFNKDYGLNTFINSVDDIKMFFQTYAYSGN